MAMQAERIWRAVGAVLERDPRVDLHGYPLRMETRDGRAVLVGTVQDIAALRVAAAALAAAAPATEAADELRLAVGEPLEDGALRDRVTRNLLSESALRDAGVRFPANAEAGILREGGPGGNIEVSVSGSVATLSGTVRSLTHRRLAEVLTWWADGCGRVVNRLQVEPPEEDNNDELADALRLVLERDPLVRADHFTVHADDGVVRLMGAVPSREEKRLALLDMWYVPGVRDVVDAVEIL
ncbi:MAG TPA: BON domain-containing protein [Gammaproteobacteria bacterium]|nr:BON domain-containing protein [Gammaproteobacteria bacterium]